MTIHSSTHDENKVLLNNIFQCIYNIMYMYILNPSCILLLNYVFYICIDA